MAIWLLRGAAGACFVLGYRCFSSVIFKKANERIAELEAEGDQLMKNLKEQFENDQKEQIKEQIEKIFEERLEEEEIRHEKRMKELEDFGKQKREEAHEKNLESMEKLHNKCADIYKRHLEDMRKFQELGKIYNNDL